MTEDAVLKFLYYLLGSFQYCEAMVEELSCCIAKHGNEKRVFNMLIKRLRQLADLGEIAIKLDGFERIDETIYSLHLQGNDYNIRILYSFLPNKEPVLLLAFPERSNHRNTDYTTYLDPARDRFHAVMEEYEND